MDVATEVATKDHVFEALKETGKGGNVLWILIEIKSMR